MERLFTFVAIAASPKRQIRAAARLNGKSAEGMA